MQTAGPAGDSPIAAEQLLGWVPRVLLATPARLTDLARIVPAELYGRQPVPGEWSPAETMHHLIDTDRLVFPVRIRLILDGGLVIPSVDQNAMIWDLSRPAADLASEFGQLREATLALVGTLTLDDLDRGATHADYGPVTIGQMLHYMAAHDLAHLQQIERAVMQPFVAGAGPWAANVGNLVMR